jgi:hypothetical protein
MLRTLVCFATPHVVAWLSLHVGVPLEPFTRVSYMVARSQHMLWRDLSGAKEPGVIVPYSWVCLRDHASFLPPFSLYPTELEVPPMVPRLPPPLDPIWRENVGKLLQEGNSILSN